MFALAIAKRANREFQSLFDLFTPFRDELRAALNEIEKSGSSGEGSDAPGDDVGVSGDLDVLGDGILDFHDETSSSCSSSGDDSSSHSTVL